MNAGPKYEYHWEDGENYKRATALSAPAYVEALMTWTQNTLDDERYFPQKIGEFFFSRCDQMVVIDDISVKMAIS